jgi:hypothetical protein
MCQTAELRVGILILVCVKPLVPILLSRWFGSFVIIKARLVGEDEACRRIGIIVANVPEGLLPQLTVQLYITAKAGALLSDRNQDKGRYKPILNLVVSKQSSGVDDGEGERVGEELGDHRDPRVCHVHRLPPGAAALASNRSAFLSALTQGSEAI